MKRYDVTYKEITSQTLHIINTSVQESETDEVEPDENCTDRMDRRTEEGKDEFCNLRQKDNSSQGVECSDEKKENRKRKSCLGYFRNHKAKRGAMKYRKVCFRKFGSIYANFYDYCLCESILRLSYFSILF